MANKPVDIANGSEFFFQMAVRRAFERALGFDWVIGEEYPFEDSEPFWRRSAPNFSTLLGSARGLDEKDDPDRSRSRAASHERFGGCPYNRGNLR